MFWKNRPLTWKREKGDPKKDFVLSIWIDVEGSHNVNDMWTAYRWCNDSQIECNDEQLIDYIYN